MALSRSVSSQSTEYLKGVVTATVTLDEQPVAVAFISGKTGAPDESTTWTTAEWLDTAATTRTWRLLLDPDTTALTPGTYAVWVKITDSVEEPVLKQSDTLTIV